MPVISLLNRKGGVGKSSCTHHLSGTLALMGRRVLVVDGDSQSSLSQGFLGPAAVRDLDPGETIAALYRGDEPFPEQVIWPTGIAGIDLLPGSRFANKWNLPDPQDQPFETQTCIRTFLAEVEDRYDVCLVDLPPNLCLNSWAALVASDFVICPLQAEDYGAQGIVDVQETIDDVKAGPNPDLKLLGFVITMFNPRKTIHQVYAARLRELYGALVCSTAIPHAADYPEAIAYRKPIAQYKPKGAAAKAIKSLAEEILQRIDAHTIPRVEAA